jgi:siroheme synthase (precorrin-2 oxidase/ferrochelatase)
MLNLITTIKKWWLNRKIRQLKRLLKTIDELMKKRFTRAERRRFWRRFIKDSFLKESIFDGLDIKNERK